MAWWLQGTLYFTLIELRAFSRSHDLAFEMFLLDDINTIAANYKKNCNNKHKARGMKKKSKYF